jgi:hypothetical protein
MLIFTGRFGEPTSVLAVKPETDFSLGVSCLVAISPLSPLLIFDPIVLEHGGI